MSHPLPWPCDDPWLRGLPAPVKNRFFYGMLLTDTVFRTEQQYGDGKRWLLNRLSLGQGVLSGLDFTVKEDKVHRCPPDDLKRWCIHLYSGVAVDGYGREIVVPRDDRDEKDDEGEKPIAIEIAHIDGCDVTPASEVGPFLKKLDLDQAAKTLKPGQKADTLLLLQIAYNVTPTDPAPVKAGRCANDCEPSKTREEYRLRVEVVKKDPRLPNADGTVYSNAVRQELARNHASWSPEANLDHVFPPEPAEDLQHRGLAQLYDKLVSPVVHVSKRGAMWVDLGLVKLTISRPLDGPMTLHFEAVGRYYRQVFSNDALSKLVFGLADRVDEAARVRILTFKELGGACGNGQSANVYQPLEKPLRLQVIDSLDGKPKDWKSIRVRFEVQTPDGGILSKQSFKKPDGTIDPYDPDDGEKFLEVGVNSDGLTEDVYWRLAKTPGQHMVSARIVPKKPDAPVDANAPAKPIDPPLHPGSQLALHATAVATAPTIIGMAFDDLWWLDDKCRKYEWTTKGELSFRFVFSRKVEGHENLADYFQVWALYRFPDCGPVVWPQRLTFKAGALASPVCPVSTDNEEVSWQVEGKLTGLFTHLCPGDTLRLVVLAKVSDNAALKSVPSRSFPTAQVVDPTFDGSFLSASFRERLWEDGEPYFDKTKDDEFAVQTTQATIPPGHYRPVANPLTDVQRLSVRRYWERFQPRECCLPSGDGTEGGEFHKSFEFRLPCVC